MNPAQRRAASRYHGPRPFQSGPPPLMSLRLKINLIVVSLTFFFAATVLALELRSMRESVHEEVVAANRVAALLLQGTALRYAAQGTPAMLAFLQSIGRIRSNDLTLFDADGRELYRSPPPTYKAGRDAPDWFSALITPTPSVQAIEFPDGKLVVRANASRAEVDAWDYVVTLAAGALGFLLVVNAMVFWLVGRAVRPFGQIVRALNQLQAGQFNAARGSGATAGLALALAAFFPALAVLALAILVEGKVCSLTGCFLLAQESARALSPPSIIA